ncbi:DUF4403 family protein [Flavobacterium sp.]|uniref:DUF4403 family protein n=1 Tax=Flavobacterium sp. TaxID=239 RepID=UPI003D13AFB2
MRKSVIIFQFLAMCFSLFSCSTTQKIELMKPEPDGANPVVLPVTSSYISFPIHLPLKDIEAQTNKSLSGLIYEDNNLEDDKIAIKIWKNESLTMTEVGGKLQSVVPLKIWAKVKYGTSLLGVDLYDVREFNLDGAVTLLSQVGMSNWQVQTQTQLQNISWKESPTIAIAGKDIKITFLINPAISIFKSKIERLIDEVMLKSLDFKTHISDLMLKASQPVEMNKTYETWLKVTPQEVHATEAVLKNNSVILNVGLKCLMESTVGQRPKSDFNKVNLQLKTIGQLPNKVQVVVAAISTFKDASRIMNANFKGKEFANGKRKVTIQNVEIWHKSGKMIIALDMTGSLNGRIYLSGFPKYKAEKKEFYFDDLDYALETKSGLLKTANWLFQGVVLQKIKENCRYSIAPNLEEGKKSIANYLNNYSPMQGVFINGKISDIDFDKVLLTDTAIMGLLNINGNLKVDVNGL